MQSIYAFKGLSTTEFSIRSLNDFDTVWWDIYSEITDIDFDCKRNPSHLLPVEWCGCGLYGTYSIRLARTYGTVFLCEFWGEILSFEYGIRAEHARIAAIIDYGMSFHADYYGIVKINVKDAINLVDRTCSMLQFENG